MLHTYSEYAGLIVNLDKIEAIWFGSRRSCHEQLLPDKHLSWNFSGKFKLLESFIFTPVISGSFLIAALKSSKTRINK
jgi:hypothetical protein